MKKTYDKDNIFAKIIRKEIPASIVYEDDYVLAFNDIAPKKKKHVLIIPKGEYTCFDDFCDNADNAEIAHFFKIIAKLATDLGITESGYRVISNKGEHGGQEVDHFHVHLLGGENVGKMVC